MGGFLLVVFLVSFGAAYFVYYDCNESTGNSDKALSWGMIVFFTGLLGIAFGLLGFVVIGICVALYFLSKSSTIIQTKKNCPSCGQAVNMGDVVCQYCGHELRETKEMVIEDKSKVCVKCGRSYPEDSNFCPKCGVELQIKKDIIPEGMIECPGCKARNMRKEEICYLCGHKL